MTGQPLNESVPTPDNRSEDAVNYRTRDEFRDLPRRCLCGYRLTGLSEYRAARFVVREGNTRILLSHCPACGTRLIALARVPVTAT